MNRMLLVALLGVATVAGCSQDPAAQPVSQLEFDLTVGEDRARFAEDGLVYQGSVGPYAVYKVTSENPRLVGPYVNVTQNVGYAMLCGATHYFHASTVANAAQASLHLYGGRAGDVKLVETAQEAMSEGDCTPPKDTFGNPIPDMGGPPQFDPPGDGGAGGGGGNTPGGGGGMTGGGGGGTPGGGGGTTGGGGGGGGTPGGQGQGGQPCTNPDPIGCNPGGSNGGGGTTGGGSSGSSGVDSTDQQVIQRLNVSFGTPPKVGSTVLLRRVALTGARQHNGSHVIPNICCSGGVCSLGAVQ